jgi:multiple antibiotic resistance protein
MQSLTFQHLLLGIFAVANNFPALGLFLIICKGLSPMKHERLTRIATLSALITMLLSLFTGELVLAFFGISIDAFRITGGILLAMSGVSMLNSQAISTEENTPQKQDFLQKIPVAIVPIGIPLTTGAGTISTITIFSEELKRNHMPIWGLLGAILVMTVIIYITFRYSTGLLKVLGNTGMNVLIKITGLFTLAIGVQFITEGISRLFPALV